MVFSRKHRGVKRRGKRGGFIVSIPLLIAGAVAAAKTAAVGAAMAAGGVAVEKTVGPIDNAIKNRNKPNPVLKFPVWKALKKSTKTD